jgi:hypothetical protein
LGARSSIAQLDRAAGGALHLAGDGGGAAEEVDVADADGGRLAEPQAGEAAQPDEGPEGPSAASRIVPTWAGVAASWWRPRGDG